MDQQTKNVHECNSGLGRQQNCEGIFLTTSNSVCFYGSMDPLIYTNNSFCVCVKQNLSKIKLLTCQLCWLTDLYNLRLNN